MPSVRILSAPTVGDSLNGADRARSSLSYAMPDAQGGDAPGPGGLNGDASVHRMHRLGREHADGLEVGTQPSKVHALFEQMLKGEIAAEQGMAAIDQIGQWPLPSRDGYIFATPAKGRSELFLCVGGEAPKRLPMTRKGDLFVAQAPMPKGSKVPYMFEEVSGERRADPWSRCIVYHADGQEVSLTHSSHEHIEKIRRVGDALHAPRTLRVWIPKLKPRRHLYVQDGQNLFDPKSMGGGWKLQHSASPDTMIIGIDNSPHRLHEYTPMVDKKEGRILGGGADAYANFMHHTVRSRIEARYGKASVVGLMGSSLGGLISLHIAKRFASSYDFVASLSGTVGWGRLWEGQGPSFAESYAAQAPSMPIYLDSGGDVGKGDNYDANRQLADSLARQGKTWNQNLFHWHEPGAAHRESAWAKRVWRPLKIFSELDA